MAQMQRDRVRLYLIARYSPSCVLPLTDAVSLSRHPCIITAIEQKDETNLKEALHRRGGSKALPQIQGTELDAITQFLTIPCDPIHYRIHMQIDSMNFTLGLLQSLLHCPHTDRELLLSISQQTLHWGKE